VATFVARKLRQWPPEIGESCLGEECRNDEVLEETIRLFKSVEFRGLGYLEMKRDARTGDHFIMEPNVGRPTGRSAIAEAGGVELLYAMYCDALGWSLPPNLTQAYGNAKWMDIRRDAQSALHEWRHEGMTLRQWWRSIRGPKTYGLFSWSDPGPFLGDLQRAFRLFLSSDERRKRDYRRPLR
jgi:predicted ATP-grasp superfamily ATP-dependent carboligase